METIMDLEALKKEFEEAKPTSPWRYFIRATSHTRRLVQAYQKPSDSNPE